MAKKSTKLDTLINEAVGILPELEKLDANRKLSFPAFMAEGLQLAGVTEKRIDVVEKIIAEKHGTEHIQAFLRRYSKALSEPNNYPQPVPDPSRPLRIYGSEDLMGQMGQFQILAGELQCLAIKVAFERFGPECFGQVENRAEHEKRTSDLRAKLNAIYEEMLTAYSGADIVIDSSPSAVNQEERRRGLCRISFKRAEGLSPQMDNWPEQLIADAVANTPKPKRERMKAA